MDCSLPGSSVRGILQARILKWIAMLYSRGSSRPWDWTCGSYITRRFFTFEPPPPGEAPLKTTAAAKSLQSCPTLCDPIDGSLPGFPVPGILQARTLDGLPFPSPMHESEKWKWNRSVVSDSSQPHGLQPTRLLRPWDFPGKSTGVGCHCLLLANWGAFLYTTKTGHFTWQCPLLSSVQIAFSSVAQLCSTLWDPMDCMQHTMPSCPSPTPGAYSNSCPLSRWCHPTISSSVVLFSSCLQSFPASESFPRSQFFTSGGQSIGVSASASVLPMNIQDWFPLGWIGLISLQSKGLTSVFSNTTDQKHEFFNAQLSLWSNTTGQKHEFFNAQLSLWSNSHIHTLLPEKP